MKISTKLNIIFGVAICYIILLATINIHAINNLLIKNFKFIIIMAFVFAIIGSPIGLRAKYPDVFDYKLSKPIERICLIASILSLIFFSLFVKILWLKIL